MDEQPAIFQPLSADFNSASLLVPRLYLSSQGAGWEGLIAEAFYEPPQLEGWMVSSNPDVKLILFAGGPLLIEQRYANGPWKGLKISDGELSLSPGVEAPYEVRWRGLSAVPTQTLHLQLSKTLLLRIAQEITDTDPARLCLVPRSAFQDPLLAQIALALWRELQQNAPVGKLYAQSAAQLLALHLLRHYSSVNKARFIEIKECSRGLTTRQVKHIADFVLAHLTESISLEKMAELVGFSPYHFARLFRQTTQESPHQFVTRLRLEQAQHLLRNSDMTLADIALASGFANQSHLTRLFKQHFGLTPRAYRRNF